MDVLSLLVALLILALGYIYFVQGLLSGLISAVAATFAAILALSLAEPVIDSLLGGRFADNGFSLALCGLFAAIYLIQRIVIDKLVPGNVRFPNLMDRIGGAVGGLVSGVMGGGIIAIAGQALPLGAAPLGSSRFTLDSRGPVTINNERGQRVDTQITNELKGGALIETNRAGLWVPVDNWVIGVTNLASNGSLEGSSHLDQVYPALLDELYASRGGIPAGAKHVALNREGRNDAAVDGVYFMPGTGAKLPQVDGELREVRPPDLQEVPKTAVSEKGTYLVVRLKFGGDAADKDGKIRFGPGSVSLTAGGVTYYPVGVLENGSLLARQFVDDPLAVASGSTAGVMVVFDVPTSVFAGDTTKAADIKLVDNVALRFKRFARIELSGRAVTGGLPGFSSVSGVLRKRDLQKFFGDAKPTTPASTAQPASPSAAPGENTAGGPAGIRDTAPPQ